MSTPDVLELEPLLRQVLSEAGGGRAPNEPLAPPRGSTPPRGALAGSSGRAVVAGPLPAGTPEARSA